MPRRNCSLFNWIVKFILNIRSAKIVKFVNMYVLERHTYKNVYQGLYLWSATNLILAKNISYVLMWNKTHFGNDSSVVLHYKTTLETVLAVIRLVTFCIMYSQMINMLIPSNRLYVIHVHIALWALFSNYHVCSKCKFSLLYRVISMVQYFHVLWCNMQ